MASASSTSGPPSSSLFPLGHDQDMYSFMFGVESHLLDNTTSTTGERLLNDPNRPLRDRNSPWVPVSSIAPPNITSHPMAGGMTSSPGTVSFITNRQPVNRRPDNHFHAWRDPPSSVPDSHLSPVQATNPFQYASHYRGTRSAVSTADGYADDGSMPGDFMEAANGMSLGPNPGPLSANNSHSILSDHFSTFTPESDTYIQRPLATAPVEITRLPDRAVKNKPYFCNHPGCDRAEGFTSESDLDRHRRTKHGVPSARRPNRSWKCQACQIDGRGRNNTRVWLRLDNFRDHCRKSHRNQDINELVARSELPEPGASMNQHMNLPDSLVLPEQSSAGHVKVERGLSGAHLNQTDEEVLPVKSRPERQVSAKGKEPVRGLAEGSESIREQDTNDALFSEELWDPPHPVVRPHSLSITSQPAHDTAMILDDASFLSFSSPSLFVNPNTSSIGVGREAAPRTKPESDQEEAEHTFSDTMLDKFSEHLLGDLIKKLKLDQSAVDQARLAITNSLQQLVQGSYDTNEDAEGTPTSFSSFTVGSGSTPPQRVAKKYPCNYSGCSRSFERQSELTKHAKRHTRPWICVWPGCTTKRPFGSKADWKRHEASTHWSHETYRCLEENVVREKCTREFARGDQYKIHLKKDHDITSESHLRRKLDQDRQVNPLPLEYLCVFCNEWRPTASDTEEAWSERFEHIEGHFGGTLEWTARNKPIISPLNHEGNSTRQGLNQRYAVYGQDEMSHDMRFDAMSNGSSSGSISNRHQNNKNARTKNRCTTDEGRQSTRNKRPRADEPNDDEYSVASSSVSRNKNYRYHH